MNLKGEFQSSPKFKLTCLGGTFDHFHKGHEFFLEKAFEVAQEVIIGVTSDNFAQKKVLPHAISSFKKRKEELEIFLKKKGLLKIKRAEIIKIEGVFDSSILDPKIECLVVSQETRKKAGFLNKKRLENRLSPLKVVVIPLLRGSNGEPISSLKIRLGEIDRKGRLIVDEPFFKKTHRLPQSLRPTLRKPLAKLLLGSEENLREAISKLKIELRKFPPTKFITVGDVVTLSSIREGIVPDLAIVDFRVGRKEIYRDLSQLGFCSKVRVREVLNKPGTLTPALFLAIKGFIEKSLISTNKKPLVVKVSGEEDLATLPAVLLSPLNSLVCYGQPKEGIVAIMVTEKMKEEIRKLVLQFQEKGRG